MLNRLELVIDKILQGKLTFNLSKCNFALVYLYAKRTVNPQIARWYSTLSEYDFEIRQSPGVKMAHVDSLSQAVVEEPSQNGIMEEINERRLNVFVIVFEEDKDIVMQDQDKRLLEIIRLLKNNTDILSSEGKN